MLSTDLFEILKFIQSHADGVYMDESYPDMPSSFQPIRIDYLCDQGYVERFPVNGSTGLRILPAGEVEIALHEYELHQAAKQEENQRRQEQLQDIHWRKDSRRSWIHWAITTLLSLLSFFGGAVAEHLTDFVELVLSFFH